MLSTAPHVPGSATSQAIRPHSCRPRMAVLAAIAAAGGLTDEEGPRLSGIAANTWRPRRRECQVLGWIRDGGTTRAIASGRQAVVWVVTVAGRHVLSDPPNPQDQRAGALPALMNPQPGDRVRELHRGRRTNATGTVVSCKNGTVTYKIDNPVGEFVFAQVDMDDLECLPEQGRV